MVAMLPTWHTAPSWLIIEYWIFKIPLSGSAIAALSTEWKFVGAIKIGDTIHCEVEVLEAKRSKSKPDRGILKLLLPVLDPWKEG